MSTVTAAPRVSLHRMPASYWTLFWADAVERFAFYGTQAIFLLYAAGSRSSGGLGMSIADAAALFGAWISTFFMLALAGGWLGDRVLSQRGALVTGMALSTAGYACLALPGIWATSAGILLTAAGGGLFKPNHQALVNVLLERRGAREAGVSLMYVGTQLSALLAPLAAGFLGETVNWHLGFALAAVAMACGVVLLAVTASQFQVGTQPVRPLTPEARGRLVRVGGAATVAIVAVLAILGATHALSLLVLVSLIGLLSLVLTVVGYTMLYRTKGIGAGDRRRLRAFFWVFLGVTIFWMTVGQAGSVLTAFARDHTDRTVSGTLVPASWLQAVTPFFMLVLAPAVAKVLPRLGRRHAVPGRLAFGLAVAGAGFLCMSVAAAHASGGARVSPVWLLVCYFGNACGELVIAAVSIAAAAEVLPLAYIGRVMGMYWLFAAVGGVLGNGVLARLSTKVPLNAYFFGVGVAVLVCGVLFVLLRERLTNALAPDPGTEPVGEPTPAVPVP